MKFSTALFYLTTITNGIIAQYATPGTGVIWNMDSLVLHSSAVTSTGGSQNYLVTQDITISPTDSLSILDQNIQFSDNVLLTVSDAGLSISSLLLTSKLYPENSTQPFKGIRIEGNSNVKINSTIITGCGGIKVLSPNFSIQESVLQDNPSGLNTGGFIEVSTGTPLIINNRFEHNELSAISSAANATVAPIIKGNTFAGNVTGNTNRPQLNLSPSGASDTTIIENNVIIGDTANKMAGGIAFSALAGGTGNVIIRNNTIKDNRYGITILGNNLFARIESNEITDNNIQNEPYLGGSGINFNGDTTSLGMVTNNTITGNLWGITVQQSFKVNLGDSHIGGDNLGLNTFSNNTNSGNSYALFNNTPNDINATNNCWETNAAPTLQNAENVISHKVDDNTLGEVFFDPINCIQVGITNLANTEDIVVYPNPVENFIYIENQSNYRIVAVSLYQLNGKKVFTNTNNNISFSSIDMGDFDNGIYLLNIETSERVINKKIIKK